MDKELSFFPVKQGDDIALAWEKKQALEISEKRILIFLKENPALALPLSRTRRGHTDLCKRFLFGKISVFLPLKDTHKKPSPLSSGCTMI